MEPSRRELDLQVLLLVPFASESLLADDSLSDGESLADPSESEDGLDADESLHVRRPALLGVDRFPRLPDFDAESRADSSESEKDPVERDESRLERRPDLRELG